MAMGGAFVSVASGADAVFWNPARIFSESKIELAGNYSMLYSVDGLSNYSAAIAYNSGKPGSFGFGWNGLSLSEMFSENLIVLAYGRSVLPNLSIGAGVKALLVSAPGYEKYNDANFEKSKSVITGDVGVSYQASPELILSATVANIQSPEISLISSTAEKDCLDRTVRIGAGYTIKRFLTLSFDTWTKDDFKNFNYDLGSEISFFDAIALRSGFSQGRLGLGLGLFAKHWAVDFGFLSHRDLGNKYQFSLKLRY